MPRHMLRCLAPHYAMPPGSQTFEFEIAQLRDLVLNAAV
jgi:hypothetical protein